MHVAVLTPSIVNIWLRLERGRLLSQTILVLFIVADEGKTQKWCKSLRNMKNQKDFFFFFFFLH